MSVIVQLSERRGASCGVFVRRRPFSGVAADDLQAARARFLGLTVNPNGALGNGPSPMSWLAHEGVLAMTRPRLCCSL
jgi:hypothetical protein